MSLAGHLRAGDGLGVRRSGRDRPADVQEFVVVARVQVPPQVVGPFQQRNVVGVPEPVDLAELLPELAAGVRDLVPAATVELDPGTATVTADRETLRAVVLEPLEDAAIHGGTAPTVAVSVDERDDAVAIEIADDGPGIPDAELAVLDDGTETQLEHGSGLGLWLATWGTRRLNGDLSFESGEDGTTARLAVPRRGEGTAGSSDGDCTGPAG